MGGRRKDAINCRFSVHELVKKKKIISDGGPAIISVFHAGRREERDRGGEGWFDRGPVQRQFRRAFTRLSSLPNPLPPLLPPVLKCKFAVGNKCARGSAAHNEPARN